MEAADPPPTDERRPLSRDRVLAAAMAIADERGLAGVTMRSVAASLGVEAMSLYHHVASKDALLDGLVEVVVGECAREVAEVGVPDAAVDWRASLRARVLLARRVMLRHPWAPSVVESRTELPPTALPWFDAILATLRAGGFPWDLAHHTMHALGSRSLGFQQELFAPAPGDETADVDVEALAAAAPTLVEMLGHIVHDDPETTLGWCDDQAEFEFGLDVLLDGIAQRLSA